MRKTAALLAGISLMSLIPLQSFADGTNNMTVGSGGPRDSAPTSSENESNNNSGSTNGSENAKSSDSKGVEKDLADLNREALDGKEAIIGANTRPKDSGGKGKKRKRKKTSS